MDASNVSLEILIFIKPAESWDKTSFAALGTAASLLLWTVDPICSWAGASVLFFVSLIFGIQLQ